MSRRQKLLKKIAEGRDNVRIEDLVTLMTDFGFAVRLGKRGGHIYLFQHPLLVGRTITVANPHGQGKKVLRVYVDNCLNAIEGLDVKEVES
jgi:hypothetical protein